MQAYLEHLNEELFLSERMNASGVQDSFQFRSLRRARFLANTLVDPKGNIHVETIKETLSFFEKQGFFFYPNGPNDKVITEHFLNALRQLRDTPALLALIRRFHTPLCHLWAEDLVRQEILAADNLPTFPASIPLSERDVRRAVLSALLTPLRQNVGSCFATAPAILIQKEQPERFLEDLYQLLMTGKLKRTFGGVEYAVPMSPTTGIGELRKKWENTPLWQSPGLIRAAEIGEWIPSSLSLFEKEALIKKEIWNKTGLSIEEILHEGIFKAHGIERGNGKNLHYRMTSHESVSFLEKRARETFKALCNHPLLKIWEYTLASFSEIKMEFSRWNLYSSLGFEHTEPGGIGAVIYAQLDAQIIETNEAIEKFQQEYEIAFDQVRAVEILLAQAFREAEIRRLKAEHQSRLYHMQACLDTRNQHHAQGSIYSQLYAWLVQQYDKKFPEYFQEIYDAEMQNVNIDFYDDAPAGFRLVYKHGRNDPSVWTLIHNAPQYIRALADFFQITEYSITAASPWKGIDQILSQIISSILQHIQSAVFLETAIQRMAKAHQQQSFGTIGKTPWAYLSGGTMSTLLKTYYCRQGEFSEESRWVESETELLIFLIDSLKNQSHLMTRRYLKDPTKGMLMTSPSHAFLLHPGWPLFKEGWQEEIFTYTWIRDHVILPAKQFYASLPLNREKQEFLYALYCQTIPEVPLIPVKLFENTLSSIAEWRNAVLNHLGHHRAFESSLDAFLREALPLIPGHEAKGHLEELLMPLISEAQLQSLPISESLLATNNSFFTAKEIKYIAKICLSKVLKNSGQNVDFHELVTQRAQTLGLAPPSPLLFADTNWSLFYFGFIFNPGTEKLELWRFDATGSEGVPMNSWKHWMDGSEKKPWNLYIRPAEYT